MTQNESDRITRLRDEGHTYAQISDMTGISINTLKSFFRRINQKAGSDAEDADRCRECGCVIVQNPKTKKQVFCSGTCRKKWWNSHPEAVSRKAVYQFICLRCGKAFTAYGNAHRKYCSHYCYINTRFHGGGRHE